MRVRGASPLLLLLAAPSLIDALELFSRDPNTLTSGLRKREAEPELQETTGATKFVADPAPAAAEAAKPRESTTRAYRGKENAPVDGYDGKPHLGPFVDTTPEDTAAAAAPGVKATTEQAPKNRPADLDKWTQAGAQEWRLEEIPEKNDGVMNDETRVGPKKGTDGTAGGISEKEKERRLKGTDMVGNKPQEPKEAPPLPHSEEEYINEKGGSTKENDRSGTRVVDQRTKDDPKYGAGGYGIDLPENLPDRPQTKHGVRAGTNEPPIGNTNTGTGKDKWLVDTMPYTEGQRPAPPPPKPGSPASPIPTSGDSSWHEWFHSFVLSLTMILFSEIGDKTFLVAALMAMRHPRVLVFSSAFSALILMTVLSAVLGHAFPALLPKRLTTFAAAVLFLIFGAKSLREGLAMDRDMGVGDEMKEVEAELEEKEHRMARARRSSSAASPYTLESGRNRSEPSPPSSRSPSPSDRKRGSGLANLLGLVLSPAWVQTFVMTFLGEWGDRSQIATIAMAAGQDYWWVTLGAVTGHACCTGLAVVGGRALAGRVSMRVVTIGGAVAFLVFGVIYLFECLTEA
ncbi:GCR1-dependent translation factor 1 [Saxophila tyrrhenica]|uniref:GCR1-dependent translation factor 1 n=1 Tax=Saxophila tyrrhenica TaxID=1690608 RepID=A0AAV9PC45_9PEZI|nr:GCR1-dependent translation factor 1 [Saxophila tyrrhenica]